MVFRIISMGIVPTQLIPALLTDSRVETLLKARSYRPFTFTFLVTRSLLRNYGSPTKIAVRNGYEIADISLGVIM